MVRARHQLTAIHMIDLYLLLSFGVSMFLWVGLALTQSNFLINSFFVSSLVAVNYSCFCHGLGHGSTLSDAKPFAGLLLTQFSLFVGCAFEYQATSMIYLAVFPCLAACYTMLTSEREFKTGIFSKDLIPPLVGVSFYLLFMTIQKNLAWKTIDLLSIAGFVIWSVGTLYWGSTLVRRENKSLISSLLKRGHGNYRWRMDKDRQKEDRMFFHDIINHTHALNLFLQQKISTDAQMQEDEIYALMNEVKSMQSLVSDHFGFKHKNLLSTLNWVELDFALSGFHRMIHSLLPHQIEIKISQLGQLDRTKFDRSRVKLFVHYPTFIRVCTNLIKNIAEQHPKEAFFEFDAEETNLTIIFKNKMGHLHSVSKDLEYALSDNILSADHIDQSDHLGLESVQSLCLDNGGTFEFAIEDGFWSATVVLPLSETDQVSDIHKKAA
ncbi:MAG: hypothetical protein COW01_11435 [Bdellovibrionales bacterium CG12_big_fil_rev_8_21_14_0_65_38_15]|nr:MAG: hypothetical protein COW79_11465 [Bdellovibrionales bacterium CG22_combo_CG10-13_8_21_14_all_38_13]PIQ54223.1 MAG: hypothetical protein COW01_11435 [Bdellovibrionales bacterium CG12_big_fil_rev_8_21_14_0_65_38_15]PIR29281.1 MAG: hypothetical protein COV38_11080 [Bdellovibrionales bacterium CG11_big_fil_rev_8_21_14_0_20_38_13]